MDIEDITHKYTGHRVRSADLLTAHTLPLGADLADAVQRAAYAVGEIDNDLADIAGFIDATVQTIRRSIAAGPGEPVPTLNFLGELQSAGPRLDALVAARHERVIRLRIVTALWRKFTGLLAPPDLGQVLAAAGFAPLTTAHASTRAEYGHRDGDREVTVSLDPYGQAGVEVTVSHGGVLAWTVTAGPGARSRRGHARAGGHARAR